MSVRLVLACVFFLAFLCVPAYAQEGFPVGIMSVGTADFPRVFSSGFRIVHNYAFESNEDDDNTTVNNEAHIRSYLDSAGRSGLKAIIGFSRHALKRGDLAYVKRRVTALKDHAALYGWYLYDEPEREAGKSVTPGDLRKVYDTIKSIDDRHPVIISFYSIFDRNNAYLSALDILAADQYPIPQYPPDFILSRIDPAVRAAGAQSRSAWAILQAHDTGLYGLKKKTGYPSRAEMRLMSYLSVMHGVKGILFYCYNDGINNIGAAEAQAHWDNVASVASELTSLGKMLSSPSRAILSPLPVIVLEQWTKEYNGAVYIIVANRSKRAISTNIRLGGTAMKDGALEVLFENRTAPVKGGLFSDAWKPYEVHVYRISSGAVTAP